MPTLPSKIFIDGGEPQETRQASEMMQKQFGKPLDGQTTNPSLIAKKLVTGDKEQVTGKSNGEISRVTSHVSPITQEQALAQYKRIVQEMSSIIPSGSISIQVFADADTTAEEMLLQGRERMKWIPNASIKYPCTSHGLKAASVACKEMPINITLAFSQSQAAAVFEATKGASFPVFISPFVGRLDDRGENGMQTIENILKLYNPPAGGGDGHVEVLTASVRTLDHFLYALKLQSPIITTPIKVFQLWADGGYQIPNDSYVYNPGTLKPIPYDETITLGVPWQGYDLYHDLTESGVSRFFSDWMGLFQ